jgi:hypothetical protein
MNHVSPKGENMHEAWLQFLLEHPTRGGLAERLIFEAGFKAGVDWDRNETLVEECPNPDVCGCKSKLGRG